MSTVAEGYHSLIHLLRPMHRLDAYSNIQMCSSPDGIHRCSPYFSGLSVLLLLGRNLRLNNITFELRWFRKYSNCKPIKIIMQATMRYSREGGHLKKKQIFFCYSLIMSAVYLGNLVKSSRLKTLATNRAKLSR